MKPLEQSIFKTLTYFDLLDFPLTQEELFWYLWVPPRIGYEEFKRMCEHTKEYENTNYECQNNYYFLRGRKAIIETRQKATEETERKLIKARRAAKCIRSVPFLRAIFVCNSVGAGMARPESDIDWFIVTEKNRVWIVRLFTNLILRLFGLRTYGSHQANRICLSFYVDTAHLDLALWCVADDDIHFAYWLNCMTPIYDPENYYGKLLQANTWVQKYLPNIKGRRTASSTLMVGNSPVAMIWKKIWQAMWQRGYGDMIEREAKKLQLHKMKFSLKEKAKLPDHGVVINDGVIKLHENDTRLAIREKWLEKLKLLNC